MPEKQHKVTLRELRSEGEISQLEAYLDKDGDLVLEGYDLGETARRTWGDSDYEYWRRVKREHVPRVLLELIKDRFTGDTAFHEWLESKGIPDEFNSWS